MVAGRVHSRQVRRPEIPKADAGGKASMVLFSRYMGIDTWGCRGPGTTDRYGLCFQTVDATDWSGGCNGAEMVGRIF